MNTTIGKAALSLSNEILPNRTRKPWFPIHKAAPIALSAIIEFLQTWRHELGLVRLVLCRRGVPSAYGIYAWALEQ